jgi:hypothetical protein
MRHSTGIRRFSQTLASHTLYSILVPVPDSHRHSAGRCAATISSKVRLMSLLHSDDEIDYVARRFIDRSLPHSDWTHSAHFAVALWLLKRRGADAMREMPLLIRAYNEATGLANTVTSGYHETITIASLRATHSWLRDRPGVAEYLILNEMLATPVGRSDWLFKYWSKAVLFSPTARSGWVEPDLEPLPYCAI